jgi:integrase/recombinase XerD
MNGKSLDYALAPTVERYVAHQRALGKRFEREAYELSRLVKYVQRAGASDVNAPLFDGWSRSCCGSSMNARRGAQLAVHKFCRYRRRLYPECFIPDATRFARRTQGRVPVIFGAPEVARMLKFAAMLPGSASYPLSAPGLRLIIILLYTTGMRRGEVERLALSDIDLTSGTIRIQDSKFHKTRIIPLSSSTLTAVRAYLRVRLAPPWDIGADAAVFGHQHGVVEFRGYSGGGMHQLVRTALAAARITDADGHTAHVHDFRHSFAVQALLRWYRQGVDVSAKLPQLSMYMGHVSIASTAHYLHFIPEIARAASRRFHREFGVLVGGVS